VPSLSQEKLKRVYAIKKSLGDRFYHLIFAFLSQIGVLRNHSVGQNKSCNGDVLQDSPRSRVMKFWSWLGGYQQLSNGQVLCMIGKAPPFAAGQAEFVNH
jgi:hypothetical protein